MKYDLLKYSAYYNHVYRSRLEQNKSAGIFPAVINLLTTKSAGMSYALKILVQQVCKVGFGKTVARLPCGCHGASIVAFGALALWL